MDTPVYSLCITHYNNVATVKRALDSIIAQIDDSFEIVIVDNCSSDGSKEILQEYLKEGKIAKLVERSCSRGLGRQIAVENSKGQYIIADMDTDDEFKPELAALLRFYRSKCEGLVLAAVAEIKGASYEERMATKNVTIGPRNLILELGNWPDLQAYEDSNLWGRAALRNKYAWTNFSLARTAGGHPERVSMLGRVRFRYVRYRELFRQGRISVVRGEEKGIPGRIALVLARITAPFLKSYKKTTNRNFRPRDMKYYVRFEPWSPEMASPSRPQD